MPYGVFFSSLIHPNSNACKYRHVGVIKCVIGTWHDGAMMSVTLLCIVKRTLNYQDLEVCTHTEVKKASGEKKDTIGHVKIQRILYLLK